jgi:hypothetical protein
MGSIEVHGGIHERYSLCVCVWNILFVPIDYVSHYKYSVVLTSCNALFVHVVGMYYMRKWGCSGVLGQTMPGSFLSLCV